MAVPWKELKETVEENNDKREDMRRGGKGPMYLYGYVDILSTAGGTLSLAGWGGGVL
jgi:hypothetical protein